MLRRTWRDEIGPIVARAIADGRQQGLDGRELAAFIRARKSGHCACAWGLKVWLDEVRIQLGRRRPRDGTRSRPQDLQGQQHLF